MSQNEIDSVIAQLWRALDILRGAKGGSVADDGKREVELTLTMLTRAASHHGSGDAITRQQALELATVLGEIRAVASRVPGPSLPKKDPAGKNRLRKPASEKH
jgi:hypothetical protein